VGLRNLLHTTTFRLAAVYVAGFAASVAALGVITDVTASALERRLDARMASEMKALQADDRAGGLPGLIATVQVHQALHPNGAFEYAVVERDKRLAGDLTEWPSVPGWQDRPYNETDGDVGRRRFLVNDLSDGIRLVVAADPEQVDEVKQAVFYGFLSAFGAVLALGILGGTALSASLLKRVETIRSTAEAIIAGDLTRRVPVGGKGDDLDRLSQTINRMLDRMAELMESLREVSVNIAHDLKTPLARLRQRLEAAQAQSPDDRKAATRGVHRSCGRNPRDLLGAAAHRADRGWHAPLRLCRSRFERCLRDCSRGVRAGRRGRRPDTHGIDHARLAHHRRS